MLPGAPQGHYISPENTGRGMNATRVETRRLADGKRGILRQRARGSVRAVSALRNTRVFLTEARVVADVVASTLTE